MPRRSIPHLTVISLAGSLLWTANAWPNDAAQEFNELFGPEIRRVQATESPDDDLELAQTLLRASEQDATSAPMQLILRHQAAALASSHINAKTVITQALAPLSPTDRISVLNAVTDQVQLRYTRSRGEDRIQAGTDLLQWMHEQALANTANGHFDEALTIYRRASATATAVRSAEWRDKIRIEMDHVRAEQLSRERFDAALARVKADPGDTAAAEELILMHIIDQDDPREARKYTFLSKDETLKLRVAQASGDITALSESETYDLGLWYESLVAKAGQAQGRYNVYARALMYLDRYLQIHATPDLTRTKATLVRDRVAERYGTLRRDLGIKDANPNAPLATLGSATPLSTTPGRSIDPAILAWTRERDALPQAELIDALTKKLAEVNDGAPVSIRRYDFDGGQLTYIMISEAPRLRNIDPLYGLKLNTLYLREAAIEDLEALRGMPLARLGLSQCKSLKSLAPLQGMPLTMLRLTENTGLTGDLRALGGATSLRELQLDGCTQLESLRGIEKASLEEISIEGCAGLKGDLSILKGMPIKQIRSLRGLASLTSLKGIENIPFRRPQLELDGCRSLTGDLTALSGNMFENVSLEGCASLDSIKGLAGMPITRLNANGCRNLTVDFAELKDTQMQVLELADVRSIKNPQYLLKLPLNYINLDIQNKNGLKQLVPALLKMPTLEGAKTGIPQVDDELKRHFKQLRRDR